MKILQVLFLFTFVWTVVTGNNDFEDSYEYAEPEGESAHHSSVGLSAEVLAPLNETQSFFTFPILSSTSVASNWNSLGDYIGNMSSKVSSALASTVPDDVKKTLEMAGNILNSTAKNFKTFEFKAGENATVMEKVSEIYEEARDTLKEMDRMGIPKILGDYTKTTLTALIFPVSRKSSQSDESAESVSKRIAEQQLDSATQEYRGDPTGLSTATLWTVITMIVVALAITAFIVLYLYRKHQQMLKETNDQLDEEQTEKLRSVETV